MFGLERAALSALAAACMALGVLSATLYVQRNSARTEAAQAHDAEQRSAGVLAAQTAALEAAKAQAQEANERARQGARRAREIALTKPSLPPAPKDCEQAATWAQDNAPTVLEYWR